MGGIEIVLDAPSLAEKDSVIFADPLGSSSIDFLVEAMGIPETNGKDDRTPTL
jgi:hypothetical protein